MSRHAAPATRRSSALRWLPTFLGFPIGGFVAALVAGPIDTIAAALLGGAICGGVLGAAQSWAMRSSGPPPREWVAATAAGLALGLAFGSALVGYGTSLGDLVVQGAICGLAIGAAQALVLRGRVAWLWAPALSALWALGWAVSTSIGIDVESQYTVFGASGALVVTAATAALPVRLAARAPRSAS